MVTSVLLSLSSNVTVMVISPAKAGSAESKVIAWTILVGGVSSTNRAVKRSSRSEVLPQYTCSDEGEQRHLISSANSAIELMDLCGHLIRCKPDSQSRGVGKHSIESFARSFDDSRGSRGAG